MQGHDSQGHTSRGLLPSESLQTLSEKQVMEQNLLSSSRKCFQHGDRRDQLSLRPRVHLTLCLLEVPRLVQETVAAAGSMLGSNSITQKCDA